MNTSAESPLDRTSRQRDLIPPAALLDCHAVVVGVGSIGRQVAIQLAAIGLPAMTLFDPDVVAVDNLGTQGCWEDDLGTPKVHAAANICHSQSPRMELNARAEKFNRSTMRRLAGAKRPAVFCCVDSIDSRRFVWNSVRSTAGFFADGRIAAEIIRELATDAPGSDNAYPTTLFAADQAFVGRCSARTTIYASFIAAGLMVSQFARSLRGLPVVADQIVAA